MPQPSAASTLPPGALYYPWMRFRDDEWVKVALLYWRRVQRIVPPDYAVDDSPDIEAFAAAGLISGVAFDVSRERVGALFAQVLKGRRKALYDRFAIDQGSLWANTTSFDPGSVPRIDETHLKEFAYVHLDKIAYPLRQALVVSGLGVESRGDDPNWFGVHPELARTYMTALAHDISGTSGVQPVTDTARDLVAVGGWSLERLTSLLLPASDAHPDESQPGEPAAALAFLALRGLVPKDASALTAAQVIEVRTKYGGELLAFQDAVRSIVTDADLSGISSLAAFQQHLEDLHADRLAPKLERLQADLRLLNVDTVQSWLSIKTTLASGSVGALISSQIDPTVGMTGAGLLGAAALQRSAAAAAHAAIQDNPAAYMLHVKEAFSPTTLRSELSKWLRRLTKGV